MIAYLPQFHECGEDVNLRALKSTLLYLGKQFGASAREYLLVKHVLVVGQFHSHRLLYLCRQFLEHLSFGAAEHEARGFLFEMRKRVRVATLHYRLAEVFLECGMMSKESRHEEIEYGPQLLHAILERRASERQAIFGGDCLHRMRILGARIFDRLRLIEQQIVKRFLARLVPFDIALREWIRRDQKMRRV